MSMMPAAPFLRQVDRLADVEHHLAEGALARQVGAGAFQDLVDIGLFAAREIVVERLHQHVLVVLLHALAHPRAQGFQGPYAALQLQLAEVLGVGVPDPLHDVARATPRRRILPARAPGSRWKTCSGGRRSRPRCRSAVGCRSRSRRPACGSGRGSGPSHRAAPAIARRALPACVSSVAHRSARHSS